MAEDNFFDNSENIKSVNEYINKAFLSTFDEGTYFTLPQSTINALGIVPKLRPDGLPDTSGLVGSITSRSNTTVFGVLNKCRTVSGQKLLIAWLQNPLKSFDKLNLRLELVQHFIDNVQLRSLCYDSYLRKVPDLMRLAFKISKENCNLSDLMKIYTTCNIIKELCSAAKRLFESESSLDTPGSKSAQRLFDWIDSSCDKLDDFMKLIEQSIDVEQQDDSNEWMVRPECDEGIAKISIDLQNLVSRAKGLLKQAARETDLDVDKSIKLEIDAEKGFGFKVTRQNEQAVRGLKNYEQLSTVKKDGYRFTSKQLVKISDSYVSAKEDYNIASKHIIEELISKTTIYDSEVLELSMAITMVDVLVSLAVAANLNNYNLPLILESDTGKIQFENLRHPCVEAQPDVENFKPNDILLDRGSKSFYIITGPNMGGKSTFIKSVGVAVIMAQCGSFVPAEDSRVSIVDGIFTRVGAGDKQMEGISTFMEEMMDMSTIIKEANENSLVVIDELGRGTSTFDGFGLAWAISHHLASSIRCYALFATHFIELTELEKEIANVGNLHVRAECRDDKLSMLFDVDNGVCDESYGINVANYTKFPERVVNLAREKLKQFEEVPGFNDKQELRSFIKDCVLEYKKRHQLN